MPRRNQTQQFVMYNMELFRRAVVGDVAGQVDEVDLPAGVVVYLVNDTAQIGMVLKTSIGDVQISNLKESQRLSGLFQHRFVLASIKVGAQHGGDRIAVRQWSSSVDVFRTVFGSVLLLVMLRTLVVRTVFGLLRADGLHRVGGCSDLAGFDDGSERCDGAFA